MTFTKLKAGKFWLEFIKQHFPLIFIIALAVSFRFMLLSTLPGGLFPDEAANGLDINSILDGKLQPFYERGNGREALFFYLLTPAVLLFGRTPFAHHLVSATLGVLVVAMTYFLVRRWFGPRMAFTASFLTAINAWYVTMSRTAFRANTSPLLVLLFFYFATRVAQAKSRREYWWSSTFAGLSFGLGFYTYISYRMLIPIVLLAGFMLLLWDFRNNPRFLLLKKYWGALAAGVISSLAALSWLILFFVRNPEWFVGRSGQVSIFSSDLNQGDILGTFLIILKKTFLAFLTDGDLNWRHNVSGYPFLSYLIAPFFVFGLIYVSVQSFIFIFGLVSKNSTETKRNINIRRFLFFLLFIWFAFMLVPEILTAEGIPHGLRLVGIIPVIFIIPALFIEEILSELFRITTQNYKLKLRLTTLALVVLFAAETVYGAHLYFGVARTSPEYYQAFRSDLTVISQYLNQRDRKFKTFLVLDLFSLQTVQYMTTPKNWPYTNVDPATFEIIDPNPPHSRSGKMRLSRGDQVIFTQSTIFDTTRFEKSYAARLLREERNNFGQVIMAIYEAR